MKAIRKIIKIPKDHKITIEIPETIRDEQMAEILVIFNNDEDKKEKADISEAMNDPMFLEDLEKVNADFV